MKSFSHNCKFKYIEAEVLFRNKKMMRLNPDLPAAKLPKHNLIRSLLIAY